MVGAIPDRYGWTGGPVDLDTYFALARGTGGLPALEMTKWFDTNYHYLVPELAANQAFALATTKPLDEYLEAKSLGFQSRPVLLGPVTFLRLAKSMADGPSPLDLLESLLPVYVDLLGRLAAAGATWVQIDEPCLVLDLDETTLAALRKAYAVLAEGAGPRVMLTTYFGGVGDNLSTVLALPVAGLHIDVARAPEQLKTVVARAPRSLVLSLGVIDGRNVWRNDLSATLNMLEPVIQARGEGSLVLAPSCSLLYVPVDLDLETGIDGELGENLARVRGPETRRARHPRPGFDGRPGRGRRRTRRLRPGRGDAERVTTDPLRSGRRSAPCDHAGRGKQSQRLSDSTCGAARAARPATRCRRPRSGRCPRPTRSAAPAQASRAALRLPRSTRRSCERKRSGPFAGRKRSGSTCSSTASPSGTTWSSTLASSSTASPSRKPVGCRATARVASARRSSSATSPAPRR